MLKTQGYAAQNAESELAPYEFERRDVGAGDILIEILYCGVCHSDLHQARNEWNNSIYPMVPGHEIVGIVRQVGEDVTKFKEGDHAGVGCFVDSCGECDHCEKAAEQFCRVHCAQTYNSLEMDRKTQTFGGYSSQIVVKEGYALSIKDISNLAATAPLLCAGITTYSPLKRFNVGLGQKVGVVGLGGLGHMGVKFAVAMGAEVTVFSTSADKEKDAKDLGAHHFVVTKDPVNFGPLANTFDFILDTVSAEHDLTPYLGCLDYQGTMVLVGVPEKPAMTHAFSLISNNRSLAGSGIGGIAETQEMLDYCAEKGIVSEIEMIPIGEIENAYVRMAKSDVRYRFVIDIKSLQAD